METEVAFKMAAKELLSALILLIGVTTLLTPTPGCPARSTEDAELDETTKLRTGSCQGWLEEELPRVAGCEVSTQKTR